MPCASLGRAPDSAEVCSPPLGQSRQSVLVRSWPPRHTSTPSRFPSPSFLLPPSLPGWSGVLSRVLSQAPSESPEQLPWKRRSPAPTRAAPPPACGAGVAGVGRAAGPCQGAAEVSRLLPPSAPWVPAGGLHPPPRSLSLPQHLGQHQWLEWPGVEGITQIPFTEPPGAPSECWASGVPGVEGAGQQAEPGKWGDPPEPPTAVARGRGDSACGLGASGGTRGQLRAEPCPAVSRCNPGPFPGGGRLRVPHAPTPRRRFLTEGFVSGVLSVSWCELPAGNRQETGRPRPPRA